MSGGEAIGSLMLLCLCLVGKLRNNRTFGFLVGDVSMLGAVDAVALKKAGYINN